MPPATRKLDDAESMFFENELRSLETRLWERKTPPFSAFTLFPISYEIDEGADTYEWREADVVGIARIISNDADDLPLVDAYEKKNTSHIRSIGDAFKYSTQEIRAAAMAGKPLEQRRRNSAARAIDLKMNQIAFAGSPKDDIRGVFQTSNASIVVAAAAAAAPNGIAWSAASGKTADEIIADMFSLVDTPNNVTNGVERVDTLVLPIAPYNYISALQKSAASDTTVLEFFRRVRPEIMVVSAAEMNSVASPPSGAAGPLSVAMAYTRSDEHLRMQIPMAQRALPPQPINLIQKVPVESRFGGVVVYLPLSMAFMEGI
jgi:hypothetical protein